MLNLNNLRYSGKLLFKVSFKSFFFYSNAKNFIYYRQMASKLRIDLPKLNEQINVQLEQKCQVYGIKQIAPEIFLLKNNQKDQKFLKSNYFDDQSLLGFTLDKNSYQKIQFSLAKRLAKSLNLDICLMKQKSQNKRLQNYKNLNQQEQPLTILSVSKFKEYIYLQYYLKELKNKSKRKYLQSELKKEQLINKDQLKPYSSGDYKNRIKSIRIGQQIHKNDINNKQKQIKNWLQQGERSFKVISANTSQKSFKALEKFCAIFQKQVQIIEQKIIINPKSKPIQRLYAMLEFDEQIQIDIEFINKRWRRREAQIKMIKQSKNKISKFSMNITKEDPQTQKMYLTAFKNSGIPYPKEYQFLTDLQNDIDKEGFISVVKKSSEQLNKSKLNQGLNQFGDNIELSEQQIKQRDKQNRKIMGAQTIEDIIQEMQELKNRQYEMQQYEAERYKQLQDQLKQVIKNAQQRNRIRSFKQQRKQK